MSSIKITTRTNCLWCNHFGEIWNGSDNETYCDCIFSLHERINFKREENSNKFSDHICDLFSRRKTQFKSREELIELKYKKMYSAMKYGKNKYKYRHLFK